MRRAQTEAARGAYDATVASNRQIVLTGFQQVDDNLAALRILEEGPDTRGGGDGRPAMGSSSHQPMVSVQG